MQVPRHRAGALRQKRRLRTASRCTDEPHATATPGELAAALEALPRTAAILPGSDQGKAHVMRVVTRLEAQSPCPPLFDVAARSAHGADSPPSAPPAGSAPDLLAGTWELVFASNGTVVTRTAFAQQLAALGALPGVGLETVFQVLRRTPSGPAVEASNGALFGLGPLGTWRVLINGVWDPTGAATALVSFSELRLQLRGLLGVRLPDNMPEVVLPVPGGRSAPWRTTYLDGTFRVGRGAAGNAFVFKRKPAG